jgi:hypothetical protein
MGLKATKPNENKNRKMNVFKMSNNLKDDRLQVLKQFYMDASGGDRVINFQEFIELFGRLNPHLTGPHLISFAERAFMTADTNYDGLLTYLYLF